MVDKAEYVTFFRGERGPEVTPCSILSKMRHSVGTPK